MGKQIMLKDELETIKNHAFKVIDNFVNNGGIHRCRQIVYKNNPDWYVRVDCGDPWIPGLVSKDHKIIGDTIENLVLIADAIKDYQEQKDYSYLMTIRVNVKARDNKEGINKAVEELKQKGINAKDIIINA